MAYDGAMGMATAIVNNKKTTAAAVVGILLIALNAAQQVMAASSSMPVMQAIAGLDWQSILSSLAALVGVLFAKDGDAPSPVVAVPAAPAAESGSAES